MPAPIIMSIAMIGRICSNCQHMQLAAFFTHSSPPVAAEADVERNNPAAREMPSDAR